ncbi:hypothetical protein ACLOEZ_10490 [Levilactobacillus brevis]|uniref:hypothetical protein n=1 Tax=Levilactobacillus brevis TaxID=1580 RepID=UPI003EC13686
MEEHPRKAELLIQLALLNPDDGTNPSWTAVMSFALDKVVNDAANYTHLTIKDFPEELDHTLVSLCQQLLTTHQLLTPIAKRDNDVKSINEGDTSVTFKSSSEAYMELQAVNTLTDNYLTQLNVFRVVKR